MEVNGDTLSFYKEVIIMAYGYASQPGHHGTRELGLRRTQQCRSNEWNANFVIEPVLCLDEELTDGGGCMEVNGNAFVFQIQIIYFRFQIPGSIGYSKPFTYELRLVWKKKLKYWGTETKFK